MKKQVCDQLLSFMQRIDPGRLQAALREKGGFNLQTYA